MENLIRTASDSQDTSENDGGNRLGGFSLFSNATKNRLISASKIALIWSAICLFAVCLSDRSLSAQDATANFPFHDGDRIALIGNTLAERMQYDGWLETILQMNNPGKHLVMRDFGFSGDEIDLRLRSKGFGTPDDHLTRFRANVIFMMFGFGESFAGPDGVEAFRQKYVDEVRRMQAMKYDGKSAPRIVLFSPIRCEDIGDPNLPAAAEGNARLEPYVEAIGKVASECNVTFVDLSRQSQADHSFSEMSSPLTINGIHLTELGNQVVAQRIAEQLFGSQRTMVPGVDVEAVRAAVLDKNFCWFHSYRTTDGYSIFGDRGELKFVEGQTNREVLTRELEILSAMADQRDPVIWGAVEGKKILPDDSNLPPKIAVATNMPGEGPNHEHVFIDPETAMSRMKLPEGFSVSLFVSEQDFPEMVNPVQMSFDTKGRLWVAVWPTYPHWAPGTAKNDKLLILEDTDGNGRADKCTVFADGLENPTGFEFWNGGVILASQPNIVFLKDIDGDDRADVTKMILHGIDSADTHHAANSFVFGPDGALYFQEGTFHHTQVETPRGTIRSANAASYRFEPRTWKLSVYTPYPYANPHGHVFDAWGHDILHDGTSSQPYDAALTSGHLDFPAKHPGAPAVYQPRTRPCPATEYVSAGNFPESMRGELLVGNVIGDLGILRYQISPDGSSVSGKELEPLILSSDPRFRPVDMEFAPDGSLYFIDWHNPIIGHMQHNLRDPSRDRAHGRVYRIRHESPLIETPLAEINMATDALVSRLLDPTTNERAAYRSRIELTARDLNEVEEAIETALNRNPPGKDRERLQLLWLSRQINQVNSELIGELCHSSDERVRAAAVRVLTDCLEHVPESRQWLLDAATDPNPRVRMFAARGASFIGSVEALEIIAAAAGQPRDQFIDYVILESMRTVPALWKSKLVESGMLDRLSPASQQFLLEQLGPARLSAVPVTASNAEFMMVASGVTPEQRGSAVRSVAKAAGKPVADVLVDWMGRASGNAEQQSAVGELAMMLGMQPVDDLAKVRSKLEGFTVGTNNDSLQRAGWLGMMLADADIGPALKRAGTDTDQLATLARTVELIPDPRLQQALFDNLKSRLPDLQTRMTGSQPETLGSFVRIELPGEKRILTLAEVEVMSNGKNVAFDGRARQSSTSHNGDASRGIDGNTKGDYANGGQTHTAETTANPWWHVQLDRPAPINSIRIHNRTESDFYKRMDGFSVQVLDADSKVVFEQKAIAATREPVEIQIQAASPERNLFVAIVDSLSHVRSREKEAFEFLADCIVNGTEPEVAVKGLLRLQTKAWNPARAPEMVRSILSRMSAIHEAQRENDFAARLYQAGQIATALLPESERAKTASQLSKLSVPVLSVGTRPHRMEYDRTMIAVEPGRRFAIVFENTDAMPHNLVLVQPGMLESIGMQAEAESTRPDALAKGFIPNSRDILAATKLIQPGESGRISLSAPTKPGVYPYVCTYPGHWRRMTGSLYVVPSVEDFLASPEAYCEANGIRIVDELLRLNASRREWKPDDFAEDFSEAEPTQVLAGRSFDRGRELFRTASCGSCHKLAGEGFQLGPDLAEMDVKWKPADVLRHILVPSEKIDDKYRTQILLMMSGNTVSGIATEETGNSITLTDNPLQQSSKQVISKDDIDDRSISAISMMPLGLLDTLSRSDILDLLAYVVAKGDADSPLYSGAAENGDQGK